MIMASHCVLSFTSRLSAAIAGGLILFSGFHASADTYTETLAKVVDSSRDVIVARSKASAEQADNHTGLNLDNPEVEFSYQWGSPGYVPDKKTIDVSQSFNPGVLSGARKRVAKARDYVAELGPEASKAEVAGVADRLMTDIVWRTRTAAHYESALKLVSQILEAAEKSLKQGHMTLFDVNSIRMEYNSLMADARLNQIELDADMTALRNIAPEAVIAWDGAEYMAWELPGNFKDWATSAVGHNIAVRRARAGESVLAEEEYLVKKENLPEFSLGFTSELVQDANYYGVAVGVQIPLWANSGKMKSARAARAAANLDIENIETEFYLTLERLYNRAIVLKNLDADTRRFREECDIRPQLAKMFNAGELSIHDYLSQLQPLLELDIKAIDAEHDYQISLVEFRAASR